MAVAKHCKALGLSHNRNPVEIQSVEERRTENSFSFAQGFASAGAYMYLHTETNFPR